MPRFTCTQGLAHAFIEKLFHDSFRFRPHWSRTSSSWAAANLKPHLFFPAT